MFLERFTRHPTRVELTQKVGDITYSLWYDEPEGLDRGGQERLLTEKLHEFASQVQDSLAARA